PYRPDQTDQLQHIRGRIIWRCAGLAYFNGIRGREYVVIDQFGPGDTALNSKISKIEQRFQMCEIAKID
ncbi:MAG: hypothetical protein AAFQ24_11605, partial [Pseudomonadota bacterium]